MNNQMDRELNKTFDLNSLSFFNSDSYLNFVYKKSERLCTAVYLITDFFPNNDSIKDNMRKSATELLRVSLSLIASSSSFRKDILNDISRLSLEIVALSKIASRVGMTSVANHDVLESEIVNFISAIEEKEKPGTTGSGFVLSDEIVVEQTRVEPLIKSSYVQESIEMVVEEKIVNDPAPIIDFVKPTLQKNDRQQAILDIIKKTGETSIKDISDNVKDCSEKTIQRELNSLIYDGILKKVGERRWSKYVLA